MKKKEERQARILEVPMGPTPRGVGVARRTRRTVEMEPRPVVVKKGRHLPREERVEMEGMEQLRREMGRVVPRVEKGRERRERGRGRARSERDEDVYLHTELFLLIFICQMHEKRDIKKDIYPT